MLSDRGTSLYSAVREEQKRWLLHPAHGLDTALSSSLDSGGFQCMRAMAQVLFIFILCIMGDGTQNLDLNYIPTLLNFSFEVSLNYQGGLVLGFSCRSLLSSWIIGVYQETL